MFVGIPAVDVAKTLLFAWLSVDEVPRAFFVVGYLPHHSIYVGSNPASPETITPGAQPQSIATGTPAATAVDERHQGPWNTACDLQIAQTVA